MLRVLLAVLFITFIARLAYRAFLRHTTVLLDLDQLGKPLDKPKLKGQAVVCGGSVAGLLAARILSDHFEQVMILDEEHGSEEHTDYQSYKRSRVLQWPYLHVVAALGLKICGILFPSFEAECERRDGRFWLTDQLQMFHFGREVQATLDPQLRGLSMSRAGLEACIRSFVLKLPNVRVLHARASDVTEIDGRYTSVAYHLADGAATETIASAFVVDATGSSRISLRWQKRFGQAPAMISYDAHTTYASFDWELEEKQWLNLPLPTSHDRASWLLMWVAPPNDPGGSVFMSRTEGNRVTILIICVNRQPSPPETLDDLMKMLQDRDLPAWFVQETLPALAKLPLTRAYRQVLPPYTRLEWNKVHVPGNFAAVGDAYFRFDPQYGQGMSSAAVHCCTLDRLLRKERCRGRATVASGLGDRAHRLMSSRTKATLDINKLLDYAWDETDPEPGDKVHRDNGGPPLLLKFLHAVIKAATADPVVGHDFFLVLVQLNTAAALFHPGILIRVGWQALRRRWRGEK